MEHGFNIAIAKEYGILEAILLKNIYFWIEHNRANNTNYYDGFYWTYNSSKAFAELFPYATPRQIQYALNKLRDAGLIMVGNYNKNAYDRTLWYTLTEKGQSIIQKCSVHFTNLLNGKNTSVKPIPDNKPNIKPNNTVTKVTEQAPKKSYGNSEINQLFDEWEKHCGFKIDTKVQKNRYACQRLIRSRGFDKVLNVLPYVAESQLDQYAPGINNFMDLAEKWNNLAVWYKKKSSTGFMKHGKITIPTNERSK